MRDRVGLAARLLLLLAILPGAGCATRASFAELGYPVLDDTLAPGERVTLARGVRPTEGSIAGWIGDEPPAGLDFRYRSRIEQWDEGEVGVVLLEVSSLQPIARVDVLAYALTQSEEAAYRTHGRVRTDRTPLARGSTTKLAKDGTYEVFLRFPWKALEGVERLALPILVRFERGWVGAHFPSSLVPARAQKREGDPTGPPPRTPTPGG